MKPSGIGGMAVMEGVMMKNKDEYAIAVRKPDNEIVVEKNLHKDFSNKVKLFKLPIFRGMLAFVDSMVIGIKVLNFSASFFEEEEELDKIDKTISKKDKKASKASSKKEDIALEPSAEDTTEDSKKKDKKKEWMNALFMLLAVLLSIVMSVSLFMVLPVILSNFFVGFISNKLVLHLLEGVIRVLIFITYVLAASQMKEIKRLFMYHGAEHKTINCLENGFELTVENVKWQSKHHKRCGTSFMLLVMLISIMVFMLLPAWNLPIKILSRVLLVPFIAGLSYEFIRLAGKTENKLVHVISKPGMWMQGLTTKEPDDSMIEVAIRSVETIFDWKNFLEGSHAEKEISSNENKNKKSTKIDDNNRNTPKKSNHKDKTAAAIDYSIRFAREEEEEDEILKALDRYLDYNDSEEKTGEMR